MLESVNLEVMESAYQRVGNAGYLTLGPVLDGNFIRELPVEAFKKGNFHQVPTLIDHDLLEGYDFTDPTLSTISQELQNARNLFTHAGPSFTSRLNQLYPIQAFTSTFWQEQTWYGDFIINCPTYAIASAMIDYNSNSSAVFKLLFAAGSQMHGATVPFLNDVNINFPGAPNNTLAGILSSYFISFIVTQDPNVMRLKKAPFWPSYHSMGQIANGESVGFSVLDIQPSSIFVIEDGDASARCEFLLANPAVVRN
jgi:carboxylesterase type B